MLLHVSPKDRLACSFLPNGWLIMSHGFIWMELFMHVKQALGSQGRLSSQSIKGTILLNDADPYNWIRLHVFNTRLEGSVYKNDYLVTIH